MSGEALALAIYAGIAVAVSTAIIGYRLSRRLCVHKWKTAGEGPCFWADGTAAGGIILLQCEHCGNVKTVRVQG